MPPIPMRCEVCFGIIPVNSRCCPSCKTLLSGASLEKSALLERLAEEFIDALREGKKPAVEDYATRFPDLGQSAAGRTSAGGNSRGCRNGHPGVRYLVLAPTMEMPEVIP
jgi:hypothetical protein